MWAKKMCVKTLTKIVDGFLLSLSLLTLRGMNLVIEFPWIQVSFERYDAIRIPCMEKACRCVYGGVNVTGVGA